MSKMYCGAYGCYSQSDLEKSGAYDAVYGGGASQSKYKDKYGGAENAAMLQSWEDQAKGEYGALGYISLGLDVISPIDSLGMMIGNALVDSVTKSALQQIAEEDYMHLINDMGSRAQADSAIRALDQAMSGQTDAIKRNARQRVRDLALDSTALANILKKYHFAIDDVGKQYNVAQARLLGDTEVIKEDKRSIAVVLLAVVTLITAIAYLF